jgi:flagellar assembly factor FliW
MRKFDSPRFGALEVADDRVLDFPRGLPGFPDCRQFIVMDHDRETPLRWLQCVDRPEVAFLIVEPQQVMASYGVEVPPHVLAFLGWNDADHDPGDVLVFVILNAGDAALTANLRAPVVVNARTRRAFQLILEDPALPLRHPIGAAPAAG